MSGSHPVSTLWIAPGSSIYHSCKQCLRATLQQAALISGLQQSNLRAVHANIYISLLLIQVLLVREKQRLLYLSLRKLSLTWVCVPLFFHLSVHRMEVKKKKATFLVRELAVEVAVSLMGMQVEVPCSASGSHKAEAGN